MILSDLSADTCHRGLILRNLGVLGQGGRSVLVNWGQDCPSSRKVYYHGHGQEVVERVCRVRHLRWRAWSWRQRTGSSKCSDVKHTSTVLPSLYSYGWHRILETGKGSLQETHEKKKERESGFNFKSECESIWTVSYTGHNRSLFCKRKPITFYFCVVGHGMKIREILREL